MRVFFINDTSDNPNWGCRGTSRAMRGMVERAGGRVADVMGLTRMVQGERFVPSAAGRTFERICRGVAWRLPVGRYKAMSLTDRAIRNRLDRIYGSGDIVPPSIDEFEPFARHALEGRIFGPERKAIEDCDVVVINGEGSIYDRQRKGLMMLFLAYLARRHFGKPCILVNHTAELKDPVMAEAVAAVYPMLDDVVFREPISAEQCRSILPDSADRVAPDAAFVYRPAARSEWAEWAARPGYFSVWPDEADGFDPARPYVCVGGSSIFLRPDRPEYDPVPAIRDLCRRLREAFGQVVLTAPCAQDERFMRPLSRELRLPLIGLHTPTQQAVDILGNADLYISGRWHPSIFALTGGTPVIVMTANTHKTAGLLQLVGLDAPTFDALRLHEQLDPIMDLARDYMGRGERLRSLLRGRADVLASRAWRNVAWLADRAEARRPLLAGVLGN